MGPANDNEKLPTTRSDAKEKGVKRYMTGKPCPHGHIAPRLTSNGSCISCQGEKTRRYLHDKWATDPEWRKQKSESEKKRRQRPEINERNKPKNAERARRRRREDPELAERSRESCREYYHTVRKLDPNYKEIKLAYHRTRRARKANADGRHAPQDIRAILKRQKYKCAECGTSVRKKANRHIDHITPLAKGGTNWPWNLQVLCPACNLSKGAKDPLDWAKLKGRLV